MGNRAVIAFGDGKDDSVGLYLHWNGGRASVEAFLQAARELGNRGPVIDNYGVARLAQIIGNYFGGTTSLGVGRLDELDGDNGDNGVYLVNDAWVITGRRHLRRGYVEEVDADKTAALVKECLEVNGPIFRKG